MSRGQWTVFGLLLFLLGLEIVRSKAVRSYFIGAYTNFNTALNSASQKKGQ